MNNDLDRVYQGTLTEEETEVTLMQLCGFCDLPPEHIIELVGEGILETEGESSQEWRFSFTTIERVKKIQRLRTDFGLTVSGVGLVMELLDEIDRLEALINKLS